MYNTVMSVGAGVALLLLVALGRQLYLRRPIAPEGWSLAFGALGLVLTLTGLHMTLTWPLTAIAGHDNIIFGEPALAFGVMLLAASAFLWSRRELFASATEPGETQLVYVRRVALPISIFAAVMGLGLFGIAAAGWRFTLFAAPPQEPISGHFANHPLVEATFISMLYVLVGIGAVLLPVALARLHRLVVAVIGTCWTVSGIAFAIFGALNYFTHIGLVIHTT
jgi:uncharacterized membrane protein